MADLHLPTTLTPLFAGLPRRVEVEGATVDEAIDWLEQRWPGARNARHAARDPLPRRRDRGDQRGLGRLGARREQRPEVVDGVGIGGVFVRPVPLDPGEAQSDAAGIARRRLHPVERDLDHELRPDEDRDAPALALARQQLPRLPLEQPAAGSRAPRWRFESRPWRRPWPHSAPRTTRSYVRTGLTFRQALPRRPAA